MTDTALKVSRSLYSFTIVENYFSRLWGTVFLFHYFSPVSELTSLFCDFTDLDLERKISVRTTREELIRRGVLKEIDENSQLPTVSAADETDSTTTADALTQGLAQTQLGKMFVMNNYSIEVQYFHETLFGNMVM